MSVSEHYLGFVIEQLERIRPVTSRRMFGAVGLYADGRFFGLIDNDRLYFKVNDTNRADYERLGMGPFQPMSDERPMQYYEVPADVLEDIDRLPDWMNRSVEIARIAAAPGRSPKKARPLRQRGATHRR